MEEFRCIVCSEEYESKTVVPVALPLCGHTFCRSCLVTLQSDGKGLSCPTCGTCHQIFNANRMPTNFSMLSVLEVNKKLQEICFKGHEACNFPLPMHRKLDQLQEICFKGDEACKCPLPMHGKLDEGIYTAAREGELDKIKTYLANGGDINASANVDDSDVGYFMLSGACYEGRINVMKELLKSPDLHLNARNNIGTTPLMTASYMGHLEAVCCLKDAQHKCVLDYCATGNDGRTALDMAVVFNNWNIAANLLEKHHAYKVQSLIAIYKIAKVANVEGASTVVQLLENVYGVYKFTVRQRCIKTLLLIGSFSCISVEYYWKISRLGMLLISILTSQKLIEKHSKICYSDGIFL